MNGNNVDYGSGPCAASDRNPARDQIGTIRGIMLESLRGIVGIRNELIAEQGDVTLVEDQARLIERGAPVGIGTVHRFFARHGITRKK